ncbi:butyryl-CoA dehydrogenase [Novosphingobium nitrogenifigens DSM 19370]|uniref:3-sulfinopropanoyl-CoA desulfinase n=1 Tax=Novosphingobium nitrogenifigens DSM 19370 TaxID=983920 RepID=F1ZBU9_9SPHN|nr:acyl-CoA dehydrogenase family protein [Novosphingobium nitrogenifigens]EGD57975.1 butyryl-CoA dehydrogenase [Novosphingobium nitrogenifigens DSM 19370]
MAHSLSAADEAAIAAVERLAREELAPSASATDENAAFPHDQLRLLAEMGLMGMNLPERWGGPGLSALALADCVTAIAAACGSTVSALTAHFLATDAILLGGGDDLRGRYLPDAAAGRTLGAFALTEPRAGSNPADMGCRAVPVEGGYRLTGTKHFISNGGHADFIVVFAVTDPEAAHRGISAFVVDRDTPGLVVGAPEKTMGLRGGHVFELAFDCLVPAGNRVGAEGSGFRTAMKVLDNGRIEVAAMCLGLAGAALDAARDWVRQRKIGGQLLGDYQGIQWMLADMATQLQAARLLTRDAAAKRAAGERFTRQSAMAKLFASETAGKVADAALQIHGGYGYIRDLPLERYVRDLRIMRIYEGSSEVQRNIIARDLLME